MRPVILIMCCALPAIAQQQTSGPVPIYQVTVVERTVKAINYKYRSDPTMIDFRGTVLLPKGKGGAIVHSKQGRTDIEAHFENLTEPQKFGLEYMTYVLWALTPDGRPHNIGEIVPGTTDKAKLHVTTDMQAFALIVTAEPYSAVRQPSNVVVLENAIRPDTVGKIEEVEAKYELLPRGLYAYHVPDQLESSSSNAPKVSMREYEALSELYQAQNAIGIARSAGADRYAPNTFAKAEQLLAQAQQIEAGKKDSSRVVETAREAAETAEDARAIALKQSQDEKIAKAQAAVVQAQTAAVEAEAEAQKAKADAEIAQAQADAERAARQKAEAEASAARDRAAQAEAQISTPAPKPLPDDSARKTALRIKMLEQLNGCAPTRDTPRGLVATIAGTGFTGSQLNQSASDQLARVAIVVSGYQGLRIEVDGHTDSPDTTSLSQQRAEAVREVLIRRGLSPAAITARGMGNSHPIGSNRTAAGREENQRVEVVISADSIGNIPYWERSYSLSSSR